MNERPLLFQEAMVLASQADTKTQTRRVVKPQPQLAPYHEPVRPEPRGSAWIWMLHTDRPSYQFATNDTRCPYGQPGDRLWVKETFYAFGRWETRFSEKKGRDEWHFVDMTLETGHAYCYAAGGGRPAVMGGRRASTVTPSWWKRPAIFMPRAASRLLLEIIDVRVERLQDISEEDALAEGIACRNVIVDVHCAGGVHTEVTADRFFFGGCRDEGYESANEAYAALWDSINGAGSWVANPWVWVVVFKRVAP